MTHVKIGSAIHRFQYRFQARTWLVISGYWQQEGNEYTNPYTGEVATIESRRTK